MDPAVSRYFTDHKVESFLVEMLTELGRVAPDDHLTFMYDYVGARLPRKRPSRASSATAIELVQEHIKRLEDLGEELTPADFTGLHEVISADVSSAAAKNLALQRVAVQLRKEDESIHAFVKEWIDQPERLTESIVPKRRMSGTSINRLDADVFRVLFEENHGSLESLISWDFDALAVPDSELVGDSFRLFSLWGFMSPGTDASIEKRSMQSFISGIYSAYETNNAYHNYKHAFSVLQGTANLILSGMRGLLGLSRIEELGLLVAALTHDVGHHGYNNDFYVKTKHKLAMRYNDQAVLENMHCALTFEALRKNNFLNCWSDADYQVFRKTVITAILNTDMKVHFDLVAKLQEVSGQQEGQETPMDQEQRKALVSLIVHAADLSNPVLPTQACARWAKRVVKEFHRQAIKEQSEGLPFAPFMNCNPEDACGVAALQISFINYVVAPMWKHLAVIIPSLEDRVAQMDANLTFWVQVSEKGQWPPELYDADSEDDNDKKSDTTHDQHQDNKHSSSLTSSLNSQSSTGPTVINTYSTNNTTHHVTRGALLPSTEEAPESLTCEVLLHPSVSVQSEECTSPKMHAGSFDHIWKGRRPSKVAAELLMAAATYEDLRTSSNTPILL